MLLDRLKLRFSENDLPVTKAMAKRYLPLAPPAPKGLPRHPNLCGRFASRVALGPFYVQWHEISPRDRHPETPGIYRSAPRRVKLVPRQTARAQRVARRCITSPMPALVSHSSRPLRNILARSTPGSLRAPIRILKPKTPFVTCTARIIWCLADFFSGLLVLAPSLRLRRSVITERLTSSARTVIRDLAPFEAPARG